MTPAFSPELVHIHDLKPHPQNYRVHPPEQIRHLAKSIEDNGLYRNIVIAQDNVILAGHGVWHACQFLEYTEIPVYRVPIPSDSPQALKILAGDNTVGILAVQDDKALASLLQGLLNVGDLLGTGYDENRLADLIFHSQEDIDLEDEGDTARDHWKDMPEFTQEELAPYHSLKVHFLKAEDLEAFAQLMGQTVTKKTTYLYYPKQEKLDLKPYRVRDDES